MEGDNLLPIHGQGFFSQSPGNLSGAYSTQGTEKLADLEQQLILETLKIHHGNKAETAKTLGIGRATLYRKLKSMSHMDTVISK
jgi:DNA-binding NtrC family response regulator